METIKTMRDIKMLTKSITYGVNMKKLILSMLLIVVTCGLFSFLGKPDLNTATLEELKQLPITEKQADDIYEYRMYVSFFRSIFDLRNIPSIDQATLNRLRTLVVVSSYDDKDEATIRREEIAYLIERYGSSEGESESMADVWEDYLITPKNINEMYFSDIMNLPNVSAIDASAIMKRLALGERISDLRDLRNTPNLLRYAANNIQHFIHYGKDPERGTFFGDYQFRFNNREYSEDLTEMYKELHIERDGAGRSDLSYWGLFNMDRQPPNITNKLRLRYKNNIRTGVSYTSKNGEPTIADISFKDATQNGKFYLGYENNFSLLGKNSVKLFLGNYQVTWGEGLVMQNTDHFSSRRTGYGFSKRLIGVIGDLSDTRQYALNGLAMEWKRKHFDVILMGSIEKRDAVVHLDDNGQPTDEVFSLITMSRRFSDSELEMAEDHFYNNSNLTKRIWLAPRTDFVEEKLFGGRVSYSPIIGTHIAVSGYESIYDKDFVLVPDPDPNDPNPLATTLMREPSANLGKFKLMDNEIASMYQTKTDNYERNFRRVIGFDWRTVLGNTSLQGEYAELSVDGNEMKLGDDPKAFTFSTFTQFSNLYLLALYRNYDLGFDNPYARPFSEHPKYRGTLLDANAHTLVNPLLKDIYNNSAQAQAEEGVYFETRYRFHKNFTVTRAYLDFWERKADSRKSARFQGDLEFQPFFQMRMRLRYKGQVNRHEDDANRSVSKTDETTGVVRMFLSRRNSISLEYRYNRVWFPPYTYLANHPDAGGHDLAQGTNLIHGDYICFDYTHNFNPTMKVQGAVIFWDGRGVSHWDWEDMEIDFMGERGMKYWFTFYTRVSGNLYLTMKYRLKRYRVKELEFRKWWNDPVDEIDNNYTKVWKQDNTIRLQLDWKF